VLRSWLGERWSDRILLGISYQLSAISYQLSAGRTFQADSRKLKADSHRRSAYCTHDRFFESGRQSSNLTGRVQIGADSCQSFVIDHRTGFISNDQRVACAEAAKESKRKIAKESMPVPVPGARIDAVRDSFYKR
jgi:hypothetical protein